MAAPPRSKQIVVEIPDDADWAQSLLAQVNQHVLSVTGGLTQSLNRADNFASQRYTLELETGATVANSFPVTFNCTLSTQPEDVRLTQARILTPGGSFAGSGSVTANHWELVSGSQIKIYNISNLNPNTKYSFAFTIT